MANSNSPIKNRFLLAVGFLALFAVGIKNHEPPAATSFASEAAPESAKEDPEEKAQEPSQEEGSEKKEPQRDTSSTTPPADVDKAALKTKALEKLNSDSAQPWKTQPTFNEEHVKTLSGGKLRSLSGDYEKEAQKFLEDFSEAFFGVKANDLELSKKSTEERTKLIFVQKSSGYPVYGSQIVFFFENGYLTRIQNDLIPGKLVESQPKISESQAAAVALSSTGGKLTDKKQGELLLLPANQEFRLAYRYSVIVAEPQFKSLEVLVDAQQARVLQVKNQVRR